MMIQAALPLGHTASFIREEGEDTVCVKDLGNIIDRSTLESDEALASFLSDIDVLTVEKEQVNLTFLNRCAQFTDVHPNPAAVEICGDRWKEKSALRALDIPVTEFFDYANPPSEPILSPLGYIAKSCRDGYDGKHQYRVKTLDELAQLPLQGVAIGDWIVEAMVPFDFEFSVIGMRDRAGNIATYPAIENEHVNGILRRSVTPSLRIPEELAKEAETYLGRLLESWDYVGVLTMECFAVNGKMMVNELAPRVHNSGHWSMLNTAASQFENHIRCVTDMALTQPTFSGTRGMLNLVGYDDIPALAQDHPDITVHLYGKSVRPGRKVGHINVQNSDPAVVNDLLDQLNQAIYASN
jgi:5-(carboxyamino)imidazole ribonucleotide synthase